MSAENGVNAAAAAYLSAVDALKLAQQNLKDARDLAHAAESDLISRIIEEQDEHTDSAIAVGDLVIEVLEEYWEREPGARIRLIRLPARAARTAS